MNTSEVAEHLGTTPRALRAFLRSSMSTYVAVGSGSRYEFTPQDLPTLTKRFADWQKNGKPKSTKNAKKAESSKPQPAVSITEDDRKVWREEGPVVLEDIRDPRVRARIKADAQAAEDRLMLQLLAAGIHVSQRGDRRTS